MAGTGLQGLRCSRDWRRFGKLAFAIPTTFCVEPARLPRAEARRRQNPIRAAAGSLFEAWIQAFSQVYRLINSFWLKIKTVTI